MLTEKRALHLRALKTFIDDFGRQRKHGEEWLLKHTDAETHILSVYEYLVAVVNVVTLSSRQYCVILDPVVGDGKRLLGQKVCEIRLVAGRHVGSLRRCLETGRR